METLNVSTLPGAGQGPELHAHPEPEEERIHFCVGLGVMIGGILPQRVAGTIMRLITAD